MSEFVFAIPLISHAVAHDWASVCRNLQDTVDSCLVSCPDRIIICGDESPAFLAEPPYSAAPISFVEFPLGPPKQTAGRRGRFLDMVLKWRALATAARPYLPGHFFILDADDFVGRSLVRLTREAGDSSLLFVRGYTLYEPEGAVSLQDEFDQATSSCCAVYLVPEDVPEIYEFGTRRFVNRFKGHKNWREVHERERRPLRICEERQGIYLRHGANLSSLTDDLTLHPKANERHRRGLAGAALTIADIVDEFPTLAPRVRSHNSG